MANTEDIIINVEVTGAKDAEKQVDKMTESLDENKKATEENEKAQEEYKKSLTDSISEMKIFGVSVGGLASSMRAAVSSLGTASKALKSFRLALASTGIGLIVIALGSLVTWLQRTRQGVDFLSDALAVVSEFTRVFLDRIAQLGGALVKLFSGDIKGAFNDAKGALTGFNEELREAISLRLQLEELTRDADQFDREAITEIARLERERAELILKSRDLENTTAQQRLDFIQQAIERQEELNQINETAALNRANIAAAELSLLDEEDAAYEDAFEKRQEALAAFIRVQRRGLDATRELQNRVNTENATIAREQKARADQRALDQAAARQQELVELDSFNAQRLELDQGYQSSRLQLEGDTAAAIGRLQQKILTDKQKTAAAEVEIEQQKNQAIGDGAAALAGGIAALFGQQSVLGKAAAVAEATINTYKAVTAILADNLLPTVAKPFFIAAAVAQGLAAVKQIQQVELPKVQIETSPFADGGHITGASHARGGVWLNAEGGEYIVNKAAMRDPVNRSIVEAINEGRQSTGRSFQQGGFVPGELQLFNIEQAIRQSRPVLILEDLDLAQAGVQVRDEITTLG